MNPAMTILYPTLAKALSDAVEVQVNTELKEQSFCLSINLELQLPKIILDLLR